jgi:hypothetical protein
VLIELSEPGGHAGGRETARGYNQRGLQISRPIGSGALTARGLLARGRLAALRHDDGDANRWLPRRGGRLRRGSGVRAVQRSGDDVERLERAAALGELEAMLGHDRWPPCSTPAGRWLPAAVAASQALTTR